MNDYITGIVEENTVTEMYHGLAFQRELTIRTDAGKTLTVRDPVAITNDLKTGSRHKFVLVVTGVEKVRAFTHSKTLSAKFSGIIRELNWKPDETTFQLVNEDLIQVPMSVIGTAFGHVLLERTLLGGVSVGNAVTWGRDQYDLVAIYNP